MARQTDRLTTEIAAIKNRTVDAKRDTRAGRATVGGSHVTTQYFWQPVAKARHVIAGDRQDYDDSNVPFTVRALCGEQIEMAARESPDYMAWVWGRVECQPCADAARRIQEQSSAKDWSWHR